MRIALVNQFYLPDLSPTAHLAASLAEHRSALGDRVTVITGRGRYTDAPAAGLPAGAAGPVPRVHRLWTPGLGKGRLLPRLLDYGVFYLQAAILAVTLPGHEVMILMTTPPYIALIGVLHRFLHPKCRLILWNMDCYPETAERAGIIRAGGAASRILRRVNRWLYRRLDSVVCLDEAMRSLVAPAYAVGGRPAVHIVPNWEPEALFPRGAKPPPWEPCEALDRRGRVVVLYMGNAGSGHRFETILDAAILPGGDSAVYLFVGGGSAWLPLQEDVDRRGLQNVILRGYVDKTETPSVLACGDVALITLKDSMLGVMSPSKMHAALAMGLPILYVGPAGGNVHDAIQKYGCGVSLRNGDAQGVVDFLGRLRQDAGFREQLRTLARRAFEADFSDRAAFLRFDALIDGEAAGPPSAAA